MMCVHVCLVIMKLFIKLYDYLSEDFCIDFAAMLRPHDCAKSRNLDQHFQTKKNISTVIPVVLAPRNAEFDKHLVF